MIFGIFGTFGIEIGLEKNPKTFGRKKLGPKSFDFLSKNFSLKKVMKIQNLEISTEDKN